MLSFPIAFLTEHHFSPYFGFARTHPRFSCSSASVSFLSLWNAYELAHASPSKGFRTTARSNHVLAFSGFPSAQKNFATAIMTWASLSHIFRASTLRAFFWGGSSVSMASAQRIPEAGHSLRPLASIDFIADELDEEDPEDLARRASIRTEASHSTSFLGNETLARSRMARALAGDCFSSIRARLVQSGTNFGQFSRPFRSAEDAALSLPFRSRYCPSISHSFAYFGCSFNPSSINCSSLSPHCTARSSRADFMKTLPDLTCPRARSSRIRARSSSPHALSSCTAASQICSELGFDAKASTRMARAPSTSRAFSFSSAASSHKISALGQYLTARPRTAETDSLVPCLFSNSAADSHTLFSPRKVAVTFE
mmetsp:Transcript_12844/g.32549  ORF Transcript_12844/g.32549 Transcript_12844/m.32549 type:complete len:369 (+) Transcript_12844:144-1250(+)